MLAAGLWGDLLKVTGAWWWRRWAPTTRDWPGDLRSSRGPTDPLRVRVLGRRAVHDVSIDYYGVNGAILAPMRRTSHAFEFFNITQFKRDAAPASSIGGRGRGRDMRQR